MTTRDGYIRTSANATDSCPRYVSGVVSSICSVITAASKLDLTYLVYSVPPKYNVLDSSLPTNLKSKIDTCVSGVCNYVSYDFETEVGTLSSSLPYIIDTRPTTTENSAVVLKKRTLSVSTILGDGRTVRVETSTPHGFLVGGTVSLTAVGVYNGVFSISSVPSLYSFTYESPQPCPLPNGAIVKVRTEYKCNIPVRYNRCPYGYKFSFNNCYRVDDLYPTCPNSANVCPPGFGKWTYFWAPPWNDGPYNFTCPEIDTSQWGVWPCFPSVSASCKPSSNTRTTLDTSTIIGSYVAGYCTNLLSYPLPNYGPTGEITSSSSVTYTPPEPPKYSSPIGYTYSSKAISGSQIGSTITNATDTTCSQMCNNNAGCVGFNFSSIGNTCMLFSSIVADVTTGEVSFRKGVSVGMPPTPITYTVPNHYRNDRTWSCSGDEAGSRRAAENCSLTDPRYKYCYLFDPNAESVTFTENGCKTTCKGDYVKNSAGFCVWGPSNDAGTIPDCETTDKNAIGTYLDSSGLCRNTCRVGYGRNSNGVCVPCSSLSGYEPGTVATFSTTPGSCTITACTTTDPYSTGAFVDTSLNVCRNTCRYQKNSSGSCIPCPNIVPGDPGTYPTYSSTAGCSAPINGCKTTAANALSATLDASGACRNTCQPGFTRNSSGYCIACPTIDGDPGTTPVFKIPGSCTRDGCTTTSPNTAGATVDATGACRNVCGGADIRLSNGMCGTCPNAVTGAGDPGTYVNIPPVWVFTGCKLVCLTNALNATFSHGDVNNICRNYCNPGFIRNSSGLCGACPNLLVAGDTGTTPYYIGIDDVRSVIKDKVFQPYYTDELNSYSCTVKCKTSDRNTIGGAGRTGPTVTTSTDNYGNQYTTTKWQLCDEFTSPSSVCINYEGSKPDASGACRNLCKIGYTRDSTGKCVVCPTIGDAGTKSIFSIPGSCAPSSCTTSEKNASDATVDGLGVCRNNCLPGFIKNETGVCIACVETGDPFTKSLYSTPGTCIVSGCQTTQTRFSGYMSSTINERYPSPAYAELDIYGICRSVCTPFLTKAKNGECTPCSLVSVMEGGSGGMDDLNVINNSDPGVTYIFSPPGSCNKSDCTTTVKNAMATLVPKIITDLTGAVSQTMVCKNICSQGYQMVNNECVACPSSSTGDPGTSVVYSDNTCTISSCNTTDINATAQPDSMGICRSTCNQGFQKDNLGVCGMCPSYLKGDRETTPVYSSPIGCTVLRCITTAINAVAQLDASGVCRNVCNKGYIENESGACIICDAGYKPNPDTGVCDACTPQGDTGTIPLYSSGCLMRGCTTTDPNAASAGLTEYSEYGSCINYCKPGFTRNSTGTCVACPKQSDPGTVFTVDAIGSCTITACVSTTDPNATGTTFNATGVCINVCKDGYERNTSSGVCTKTSQVKCSPGYFPNAVGTCVACPVIGDTGTKTILYSTTGMCMSSMCTTTDTNASSAAPDSSGVCRNVCKAGYFPNATGTCVMCPTGDIGTTATSYASTGNCVSSTCTTTDTNASSATPDASGICRNNCKTGYKRNTVGTCVAESVPCPSGYQKDAYGACVACPSTAFMQNGLCLCTATPDPYATGSYIFAGKCFNDCPPGYISSTASNKLCVACPAGDAGTTTTYFSKCSATRCTTTDTNASSVSLQSGYCRNTCKLGLEKNTSGACVCTVTSIKSSRNSDSIFDGVDMGITNTSITTGMIIKAPKGRFRVLNATPTSFYTFETGVYTSGMWCSTVAIGTSGETIKNPYTPTINGSFYSSEETGVTFGPMCI